MVEHIGGWDEFRRHLSEVKRVLKPGGVYVATTEISYGNTIEALGNYKFNEDGLQWWLQEFGMAYEPVIDCRIAHNYINTPLPVDPMAWITADDGRVRKRAQLRLGRQSSRFRSGQRQLPASSRSRRVLSCQGDWNYAVYGNALDGLELREVQVLIQDARSSGAAGGRRTIGRAAERVDLETG